MSSEHIEGEQENHEVSLLKENINTPSVVKSLEAERDKRWKAKLDKSGKVFKKTLRNAAVALRHSPEFKGSLKYDAHAHKICAFRLPPWASAHEPSDLPKVWSEQDTRKFSEWLQGEQIDIGITLAGDAVQTVAQESEFHPVRDYFEGLVWDGTERLKTWLTDYLGVEQTPYTEVVGAKWMISGVARIMRPGCKADCLLQLHGTQGLGKSTALETLAVRSTWFNDEISDIADKDSKLGISGRLIVEFAELEAFVGKSGEAKKAFISRTVDRFRPHYGRMMGDYPRQCIFAATTNKTEVLEDPSGNRRFWPVICTRIDIPGLKAARDQLWAEAKARFDQGETWWLDTPEQQESAKEAQEHHFAADSMEEKLAEYLVGRTETTYWEVLESVMEMTLLEADKGTQRRVANMLQHLGWERFRRREGDKLSWAYRPIKPLKNK